MNKLATIDLMGILNRTSDRRGSGVVWSPGAGHGQSIGLRLVAALGAALIVMAAPALAWAPTQTGAAGKPETADSESPCLTGHYSGGGSGGTEPGHEMFGYCIAVGADADGDDVVDYAIGEPGSSELGPYTGSVVLFSGKTKQLLRRWSGLTERQCFGVSVAFVGDWNGDLCADLAVGSLFGNVVHVYSGKSGEEVRRIVGPRTTEASWFGSCVRGVGDLNADGLIDLAVGAPRFALAMELMDNRQFISAPTGFVEVVSGADGKSLLVQGSTESTDGDWLSRFQVSYLGRSIVAVGDLDGDSVPDIAMGAPGEPVLGFGGREKRRNAFVRPAALSALLEPAVRDWCDYSSIPRVLVVSGKTGKTIFDRAAEKPRTGFGAVLASIGDFDGDGHPDLAAGAWQERAADGFLGAVHLLSGLDGHDLAILRGDRSTDSEFGYSVVQIDDLDGDGARDLAIGDPVPENEMNSVGRVLLVSIRSGKTLRTLTRGNPGLNVTDFGFSLAFERSPGASSASKLFVGAIDGFWGGRAWCFAPATGTELWYYSAD